MPAGRRGCTVGPGVGGEQRGGGEPGRADPGDLDQAAGDPALAQRAEVPGEALAPSARAGRRPRRRRARPRRRRGRRPGRPRRPRALGAPAAAATAAPAASAGPPARRDRAAAEVGALQRGPGRRRQRGPAQRVRGGGEHPRAASDRPSGLMPPARAVAAIRRDRHGGRRRLTRAAWAAATAAPAPRPYWPALFSASCSASGERGHHLALRRCWRCRPWRSSWPARGSPRTAATTLPSPAPLPADHQRPVLVELARPW